MHSRGLQVTPSSSFHSTHLSRFFVVIFTLGITGQRHSQLFMRSAPGFSAPPSFSTPNLLRPLLELWPREVLGSDPSEQFQFNRRSYLGSDDSVESNVLRFGGSWLPADVSAIVVYISARARAHRRSCYDLLCPQSSLHSDNASCLTRVVWHSMVCTTKLARSQPSRQSRLQWRVLHPLFAAPTAPSMILLRANR